MLDCDLKQAVCVYHENNMSKTQQDIANLFTVRFGHPINRQTVRDILGDKTEWLDGVGSSSKHICLGKHAELGSALQVWFSSTRSQNVVITDAILREKVKQFVN